jgi:aminopeptidase N
LIGEDSFSSCLKKYFNTFAWANTTFSDFIKILKPEFEAKVSFSFE